MISFGKSKQIMNAYAVYFDTWCIGSVQKKEHWTVRGTRRDWSAYRKGKCIGTGYQTRNEAAQALQAVN